MLSRVPSQEKFWRTEFGRSSIIVPLSAAARWKFLGTAVVAIALGTTFAVGQAPPVLNQPYQCANGITYTVSVCKPLGSDQWCQWTERQNGQVITTVNSAWSSMTGRLQGCTVAAPATSSTTNTSSAAPTQASTPAQGSGGAQQASNPPYLKEFPTVDQVMAQMKGTDAKDTANRQMGAFEQLQQILKDLAGPRLLRGQLTADESRTLGNYNLAYTNLAKPLNYPDDGYFANPDFVATLFNTFPMPTVEQQWRAQNKQFATRIKAGQQQTSPTQPAGSTDAPRPLPPTNDPSQIAIRRCFELGGTGLTCVGAALSHDTMVMMGMDPSAVAKRGLVVVGTFSTASGLGFDFTSANVNINNCGKMVRGYHNYSVTASGGRYVINIENQPQPLVVTLSPDRKGSGPAAQDITGQQVTSYEVTTNIRTGEVVGRQPFYGPVTVHCNIGALTPGPDVDVSPGISSGGPSVLSAVGSILSSMAGNTSKQLTVPAGPRMGGVYKNAGGLTIQFNDGSAVIDCAKAHVLALYDVSSQGGQVNIAVKNETNPFNLTVNPDGTLSGSGTATINGKIMTALSGADPVFESATASCPANSLTAAK
jgi:hypothetical protein